MGPLMVSVNREEAAAALRRGRELYLLELHLRGLVELLALLGADVEELLRGEAERASEQHRGELLDAGVVLLHGIIEEAAGRGQLVLDVGELALQLLEVLIGLEIRIGLAQRKQLPQRAGERVFSGCLRRDAARSGLDRGVARLDHGFERAAL